MNRDVCEHSTPVDLPCDKCHVANRGGHIAVAMSRIADLESQCDALLEALKELTPPMPPADAPCHVGLVPQEKCAHCGRIARARAAIKAVEETK